MTFEALTAAIMHRRAFGQALDEVHGALVNDDGDEELFFLAWHAAQILMET